MFRPIRRKSKEISLEETKEVLRKTRIGVFSVNGDNGYPYSIPVNFVYDEENNKIYFHGAKVGHKVDSIKKDNKVCFTVYGDEVIKDEEWAPYVKSAVVFGRCILTEDHDEALRLCKMVAMKYYPSEERVDSAIEESGAAVQMYEIEIEHLSGKELQEK